MASKHLREEELDSEFEFSSSEKKKRKTWREDPLAGPGKTMHHVPHHSAALPSKQLVSQEQDKEEWRARRFHYLSMNAYSRHKALVNHYLLFSGHGIEHMQRSTEKDRNDYTVLSEQHKFLWDDNELAETWERRLAKAYYDRLFKEYAICDLTRYKENKIAMRWRTEKEVVEGKGQFACASKHCSEAGTLQSWEVNFNYAEHGEKKCALVKLRLCEECSTKLNHHHKRKLWKRQKRETMEEGEQRRGKKKEQKEKKTKKKKKKGREGGERVWEEKGKGRRVSSDSELSGGSDDGDTGEGGAGGSASVWSQSAKAALEKPQEEEFDDYFKDMLL